MRDSLWFCSKSKPGSQLLTTASSCPGAFVGRRQLGPLPGRPFPGWTGRRLGLGPEEAPRHWLAGQGPGARERLCAVLDLVKPRQPSPRVAPHNKSGPRPRWPRCRRLALYVLGGQGGGVRDTRRTGARTRRGRGWPCTGWRGAPGTPASLAGLLIGLLFALWLGVVVFFKVTPEDCRLPRVEKARRDSLRVGWGGGGEMSPQDAAGRVIRQQVCGWCAPPPLLQGPQITPGSCQ